MVPKVVDLPNLDHFHGVLKKTDLFKMHEDLRPDLHRLREQLKTSLPSTQLLPSILSWQIVELLTNCWPERFLHSNHSNVCLLVKFLMACFILAYAIHDSPIEQ